MNYFGYAISRAAAFLLMGLVIVAIQMAGARLSHNRLRAFYEQLGSAVSDNAHFRLSWFFWPPHYRLLGEYHGRRFRYEIQKPQVSHILIDCRPRADLQYDARPRGQRLHGTALFPTVTPHWAVLVATQKSVPLWQNSADRRPPGFGSRPGVTLHRIGAPVFDGVTLAADLAKLLGYCEE